MTERPILFSAPMVRALLDGRKTQTRRAVKGSRSMDDNGFMPLVPDLAKCPYGARGDFLWVRENFRLPLTSKGRKPKDCANVPVWFEADRADPKNWPTAPPWGKLHPAIHMPRWACRISLRITSVRIERLNDCTESDALAEGVAWSDRWQAFVVPGVEHPNKDFPVLSRATAREMYAALWDTINGSGEWLGNPWVWVVSFERA